MALDVWLNNPDSCYVRHSNHQGKEEPGYVRPNV
jgi:hypothetical protein